MLSSNKKHSIAEQFEANTGFPYATIKGKEYLIEDTCTLAETGLFLSQDKLDEISVNFAQSIDTATQQLFESDASTFSGLCYPIELINLMKTTTTDLSYMRLGFVVDKNGLPKLIEVNSQTPSFNFELEGGTDELLHLLNQKPRDPYYKANLIQSLIDNLETCAQSLGMELKDCNVGLLTCDSVEDIYQMNYIKTLIDNLNITQKTEVLTNLTFDFDHTSNKPFNSITQTKIDILFNWYPLELTITNPYPDGSYFYKLLEQAIKTKQVAVYNGTSFITQNKYLLVYMQENDLVPSDLSDYWTPSFYTKEELEQNQINNWIGKPIWGRQGSGVFGQEIVDGVVSNFNGDMSDSYYNEQYYIYQKMWDSYPITLNNTIYKSTLEKFVYKTNSGWKAGGQGLRISPEHIINNDSSWLILQ
jgi:glutathionylspermidine synthase